MKKFREGDRLKVVEVPEDGQHFLGKTGIVIQPHSFGYEEDDVMVKFDNSSFPGYWKEHQLEKISL